ncbi:MAG: thioesterase family protein [Micropepsaceae bacterium]
MRQFTLTFTALGADIDELGHVNNAVWVRWVQDLATAHWAAAATPAQVAAYVWVVVRHEVDYMGNLNEGESVAGRTWVAEAAIGAKFDRFAEFSKDGRVIVRAKTTWVILARDSARPIRVPRDVVERFA